MERTGEKKETLSLNQVSTPRVKPAKNETKAPRRELWGECTSRIPHSHAQPFMHCVGRRASTMALA